MRREAEAAKLRKEANGPQSSYLDFQGQRELTKDCKVRVLHTHKHAHTRAHSNPTCCCFHITLQRLHHTMLGPHTPNMPGGRLILYYPAGNGVHYLAPFYPTTAWLTPISNGEASSHWPLVPGPPPGRLPQCFIPMGCLSYRGPGGAPSVACFPNAFAPSPLSARSLPSAPSLTPLRSLAHTPLSSLAHSSSRPTRSSGCLVSRAPLRKRRASGLKPSSTTKCSSSNEGGG